MRKHKIGNRCTNCNLPKTSSTAFGLSALQRLNDATASWRHHRENHAALGGGLIREMQNRVFPERSRGISLTRSKAQFTSPGTNRRKLVSNSSRSVWQKFWPAT